MERHIVTEENKVIEFFPNGTFVTHESIHPPLNPFTDVICAHCGKIYDLTRGKVDQRFSDCTVFTTECCNRQVDDRGWKEFPDFEKLDKFLKK